MNGTDAIEIGPAFIQSARQTLDESVKKIDHCLAQISEEDAWWRPFAEANSIANIVLHLCGNVGQWIISGVGGAPDARRRPEEFAARGNLSRAQLRDRLHDTLTKADQALATFPTNDLLKVRHIQHWDVTALKAIFDATTHFVGHTHQIVYITRLRIGDRYKFLGLDAKSD